VTASRVAAVRGKSPFRTPTEMAEVIWGFRVVEVSPAMKHGTDTEDAARECYEKVSGNAVKEFGMITHDDHVDLGYSPDGVIGDDGLLEIKCPKAIYAPIRAMMRVAEIIEDDPDHRTHMYTSHYDQVQLGMHLSERKWCDYFIYVSDDEYHLSRVIYDPQYCAMMLDEVYHFIRTILKPMSPLDKFC